MSCCDCGPWVVCPLHTNYDQPQPQPEPEQPPQGARGQSLDKSGREYFSYLKEAP